MNKHLQNASVRPEEKWKWNKFKPPEEAEHLPRLGQENVEGTVTEQGLFSQLVSQKATNNASKHLAQVYHLHFPHIPLQLKTNSQENKNLQNI